MRPHRGKARWRYVKVVEVQGPNRANTFEDLCTFMPYMMPVCQGRGGTFGHKVLKDGAE